MTTKKTETINAKDQIERDIIELIDRKGKCLLGEILMQLKLGYDNGYQTMNKLMDKQIVSNEEEPPYFTLKVKPA